MLKVLVIFGTRPEAIKMAPLVKMLKNNNNFICEVAVTAQHRGMLDQVLDLFELKPEYDLNIMKSGQDLFDVTSNVLIGLRDVLDDFKPDIALVHGDTTTCFAGALAAFYKGIRVGHVEAGLRTGDLSAPFPEEANRTLVANITNFHFAPTDVAKQNLVKAGVSDDFIWVTGNTVIDALFDVKTKLKDYSREYWEALVPKNLVAEIVDRKSKFVLITGHRRENFGTGFLNLCASIKHLALMRPDWLFIYPVHLNPNVQKPVFELLAGIHNIMLVDPVDYLPFVWMLNECDLVITDSGGIQEEAPSLGKPVLVTRDVTERPEAVAAGTVELVGTDKEKIISKVLELLDDDERYQLMARTINPYGDGHACKRITSVLESIGLSLSKV